MKKTVNYLLFLVFVVISDCSPNREEINKYQSFSSTDSNGFNYKAVTNDPTGTRIHTLKNGLKVYLTKKPNRTRINATLVVNAESEKFNSEWIGSDVVANISKMDFSE